MPKIIHNIENQNFTHDLKGAVIVNNIAGGDVSLKAELDDKVKNLIVTKELIEVDDVLTKVEHRDSGGDIVYQQDLSYTGNRLDSILLTRIIDNKQLTTTLVYDGSDKLLRVVYS